MTVKLLAEKCGFGVEAIPEPDREINGCYIGDLLSWVMGRANADEAWITIMSNINIVAVASLADVSCIILAEGVTVDDNVKSTAEAKGVNILTSGKPAFETAMSIAEFC